MENKKTFKDDIYQMIESINRLSLDEPDLFLQKLTYHIIDKFAKEHSIEDLISLIHYSLNKIKIKEK